VRVAFIGMGHMGLPMARNLAKAGHAVTGFDIVPALVERAAQAGIAPAPSIAACVSGAEWVVTMLPSSPHVRAAWAGPGGVLEHAPAGARFIDSSTIDPMAAREVAALAAARGHAMIDAPVSGGTAGAEAATLTFMVGGDAADFEAARALLASMGKNLVHCGAAGNGQVAKICNNLMLAIGMIATSEGMALATRLGMDPKVFAGIVNTSSGRCWSSDTYNPWPGVLDSAPASRGYTGGFGTDLMLKDLGLAADAARAAKVPILAGSLAQQLYQRHSSAGHGALDFSSIVMQVTGTAP